MKIFVLIILCFYTLRGLFQIINGFAEDDGNDIIAGIVSLISGIIAIVFQSMSL